MSYQDRRALMAAVSLLCVTVPCSAFAQFGPAPVPAAPPVPEPVPGGIPATSGVPQSLRWTEDWGIAADPAYRRDNPLERLRNLPISDPDIRLSIGGEMRYYYQSWTHQNLGASANDANHNLGQRLRLVTELRVTPFLRIFSELGHNKEYDATTATPPNRDKLEFQQIFADITVPLGDQALFTLRPGRFEMPLGNGKLVGLRDGTNVRFTYQGVRGTFILKNRLRIDAFAVRPMQLLAASFDDKANPDRHFNGVTVSAAKGLPLPDTQIDVYHYDVFNKVAKFALLTGEEHRESWGMRIGGKSGAWDYDAEGTFQTGHFAGDRIRAWGFNSDLGYSLPPTTPLRPRVGLRFDAFSGDGKPNNGTLGTFAPPAPRLPLFGDAGYLNFSNIIDLYPNLTVKPAKALTLVAGPEFFWRETKEDATYAGPTNYPGVRPVGSSYVGTGYNFQADWIVTKNLSYRFFFTRWIASEAFKAGGGKSSDYVGIWQQIRF
ncbi:alginate export family protein [Sphingobium sp.]|jgi:hypothetical protein|uniref:alginate export family protein n=1 Tax=Sphingobium sp. TaxID=1912891 RepID=UPI0025809BFE|nr:alginate export family protein [Sphingobium sp.]MBR2270595.1 alginate export family protein [Sphingobium sp.]